MAKWSNNVIVGQVRNDETNIVAHSQENEKGNARAKLKQCPFRS